MTRGALLALLAIFSTTLALRAQVTFEAFADARQVYLDGFFDVTFSLKNGKGEDFTPPDFQGVELVSGPRRAVSTTIINGQVSNETNIIYTLKPERLGALRIGPARITVDGEVLRSNALRVDVVERETVDGEAADEPIFIRSLTSVDSAYVGQQVSLDYKLYTSTNIESYNVLQEAEYPGFFAQDLKRFDSRVMRELLGGQQYTTKVLKRVALFPQQAGLLQIDPMRLQLGVVEGEDRSTRSFFFNRKIRRVMVESSPAAIRVMPLPANPPETFTGAVGDYDMNIEAGSRSISTDEVLSLRVSLTGTGDIKRVLPPALPFPASFDLYDPRVLEESTFEVNGRIQSRKTFEYLAQPTEAGDYRIEPAFTYFDPDSSAYVTLHAEPIDLSVEAGSGRPRARLPEMAGPAARDIRYLKTVGSIGKSGKPFFQSVAFWGLTALPFFVFLGMIGTQRVQRYRESLDPTLLRRKRARKQALKRLRSAKIHLEAGENRAFYDEVSKSMLGYVGDKLQIPRSDLSKENVRAKLVSLGVEESLTERFVKLLQTCEMALFAGRDKAEGMQEVYTEATELLTSIEQAFRGKDP